MTRVHGNTRWTAEHQAKARRLYVEEGRSAREIAKEVGPSERRIHEWAREDNWKKARAEWAQISGVPLEALEEKALRRLMGRLEREGDELPTEELLALLKYITAFKTLIHKRQGYRLLDAALVVGDEFQAFVLAECPAEAPRLLEAWKGFITDLQQRSAQ
jgi:transposase-like protein